MITAGSFAHEIDENDDLEEKWIPTFRRGPARRLICWTHAPRALQEAVIALTVEAATIAASSCQASVAI